MTPILLTPPTSLPVTLADAKLHCRIDGADDDTLLSGLIAAAVGHLDGWTGVLGRCIMPQTWQVSVEAGDVVLPMPNVASATAGGPLVVRATPAGPMVTVAEDCDITFTCAMPAQLVAVARVAVLLVVGHWYENREAVGGSMVEVPMAATALIDQMRWVRL